MQRLVVLLIFLTASVWLGLTIVNHPGYLFIVTQPWMVQMPLWFALLALFVLFGLFYLLVDSIDRLQFWWFRVKNWFKMRRTQKSYSKTQHGLSLLIEGQWSRAEKLLMQGADQASDPLINYLGAARAAHELKAYERCEKYIQRAYKIAPHSELAIGITQAELELRQDQLERAAGTLDRLRKLSSRHPRVLELCEKVYVRLGDWEKLRELLPDMRKAKVLSPQQIELFEKNIYCEILQAASGKSRDELNRVWNDIPRTTRQNVDVITAYVKQLLTFGNEKEAKEQILKTLKCKWAAELVTIYSTFTFENLNKQLVIGAAWLTSYGEKPEILLFLGKVCVQVQLWGKAKDYFKRCLQQGPNPGAALAYGKLLVELGENDQAMQQYQNVLGELSHVK